MSSASRTKVIDDEMDYFSVDSNRWLSEKEREKLRGKEEELRRKKYASRREQAVTLDFAGRKVVEENSLVGQFNGHLISWSLFICVECPPHHPPLKSCFYFVSLYKYLIILLLMTPFIISLLYDHQGPPPIAGNFPTKSVVARQQPTYMYMYLYVHYTCTCTCR